MSIVHECQFLRVEHAWRVWEALHLLRCTEEVALYEVVRLLVRVSVRTSEVENAVLAKTAIQVEAILALALARDTFTSRDRAPVQLPLNTAGRRAGQELVVPHLGKVEVGQQIVVVALVKKTHPVRRPSFLLSVVVEELVACDLRLGGSDGLFFL